MDKNTSRHEVMLEDYDNPELKTKAEVLLSADHILVRIEGYGDHDSADGEGWPILIEVYEGKPRILVWGDINYDDATHTIDLSEAKESLRKEV